MDFQLYARVLWRFRLVVLIGLILALGLALLSMVRVGQNGISYRDSELWSSSVRLLVTQTGFPEGRLYAQDPTQTEDAAAQRGTLVADPARFNNLAILYAELAASDPVRQVMRKDGPVRGKIVAAALRDEQSGTLLPLIDLAAIDLTARGDRALAPRRERP